MASTFENDLRLEEMATGENAGSWGTKTNTNLELIADAFGYGTFTIADADTTLTMPDGSDTDNALRSLYLKISSSADLTTTRTLTLAPNTVSKLWYIENNTSGGQTITISQGSGANISILNGQAKLIATDGAGAGAAVIDATQDLAIPDLFIDDDLSLQSDGAIINFGADADVSLTHVADTGLRLNAAMALEFRDGDLSINSSADGQLDIDADTEIEIVAPTVDIDASTEVNISGDLKVDTDTLYVDSTNNRVGIGTSSPKRHLHINDPSAVSTKIQITNSATGSGTDGDGFQLGIGSVGQAAIEQRENQPLTFSTNNTERLRIDSSGNIGIGTSSPTSYYANHLVVDTGGSSQSGITIVSDTTNDGMFAFADGTSGDQRYRGYLNYNHANDSLTIGTAGGAGFTTIDSSGNIGVGTTAPSQSIDTTGKVRIRDGGNTTIPSLQMGSTGVDGFALPSTNTLGFITNSSEAMRIDSSGNVGIGATSPSSTFRTSIHGDGSSIIGGVEFRNAAAGGSTFTVGHASATSASGKINVTDAANLIIATNDTERMRVDSSGNVGIGTSSPNSMLHVKSPAFTDSTIHIDATSNNVSQRIDFRAAGTLTSRIYDDSTKFELNAVASKYMAFKTNDTERMRIDSSGNVGIGTTSPSAKLHVDGNAIAKTATSGASGTVTLDFGANQNWVLTLTGNITLANPSTEVVGQSGFIVFIQDGTGGRTVSLGTDYETAGGAGLTLSSSASTTDVVPYIVAASGRILLGAPQLAFA